jgi:hypothetical protein
MTTSYNGWTASKNSAEFGGLDNSPIPDTDVTFAPGFRRGDVAFVLQQFFARFHVRVEPLVAGWCWGYFFKTSANSAALISCHSSASAGDANAPRHPNGKKGTFTAAQVAEIRRLLAEFDGLIYWGGDGWGKGTWDEMHFEIRTGVTVLQIATLADRLRGRPSSPLGAPSPNPPEPWLALPDLRLGTASAATQSWQRWFNAYPFKPAILPVISPTDVHFGPKTEAAIKAVQTRYGLTPDGIVGPRTKRLLWDLGWRG